MSKLLPLPTRKIVYNVRLHLYRTRSVLDWRVHNGTRLASTQRRKTLVVQEFWHPNTVRDLFGTTSIVLVNSFSPKGAEKCLPRQEFRYIMMGNMAMMKL
jgi:hypothetical protein